MVRHDFDPRKCNRHERPQSVRGVPVRRRDLGRPERRAGTGRERATDLNATAKLAPSSVRPTLTGQTNIQIVSNATFGKLMRAGAEGMWAFLIA